MPRQLAEQEERIITVDDVLRALDEALGYVQEQSLDEGLKQAIIARITLRIVSQVLARSSSAGFNADCLSQDLVYALALLTSPPHTSPTQVSHHLTRIMAILPLISTPAPTPFTPSPRLLAIFALGAEAPLPSPQPPREIVPHSMEDALSRLGTLVGDVESAMSGWEKWRGGSGWKEVRVSRVPHRRRFYD